MNYIILIVFFVMAANAPGCSWFNKNQDSPTTRQTVTYKGVYNYDTSKAIDQIIIGELTDCLENDSGKNVAVNLCSSLISPIKYLCDDSGLIQEEKCPNQPLPSTSTHYTATYHFDLSGKIPSLTDQVVTGIISSCIDVDIKRVVDNSNCSLARPPFGNLCVGSSVVQDAACPDRNQNSGFTADYIYDLSGLTLPSLTNQVITASVVSCFETDTKKVVDNANCASLTKPTNNLCAATSVVQDAACLDHNPYAGHTAEFTYNLTGITLPSLTNQVITGTVSSCAEADTKKIVNNSNCEGLPKPASNLCAAASEVQEASCPDHNPYSGYTAKYSFNLIGIYVPSITNQVITAIISSCTETDTKKVVDNSNCASLTKPTNNLCAATSELRDEACPDHNPYAGYKASYIYDLTGLALPSLTNQVITGTVSSCAEADTKKTVDNLNCEGLPKSTSNLCAAASEVQEASCPDHNPYAGYTAEFTYNLTGITLPATSDQVITGTVSSCAEADTKKTVDNLNCASLTKPTSNLCATKSEVQNATCADSSGSSVNLLSLNISAGGDHTCGITSEGVLKCWGWNLYGQLGNLNYNEGGSPAIVDSNAIYSQISTGYYHTCGIVKVDNQIGGTLKCWGSNEFGQLGNE